MRSTFPKPISHSGMDNTIALGMSLMPTTTTGITKTYTGFALDPDPWLQGALRELRRTVDDDFVAVPGFQQRIWSRIVTEIETDETAGFERPAQMAG